jgi:hypothetical protein
VGISILTTQLNSVSWAQCVELDFDAPDHIQIAQICKTLSASNEQPIHVVAFPGIAKHFPALQVFFRTNHFQIRSYICVNELPEGQLGEWPDAPVTYIDTATLQENLNLARLRDWNIITTTDAELHPEIISCAALYE